MLRLWMQKMSATVGHTVHTLATYEEALTALADLQSNVAYVQSVGSSNQKSGACKLDDTRRYLVRSGMTLQELDRLSVIHVAGTKGKGSTCAFVEKILRTHGFHTGFFSSPHLVSVRERIRINGQPISTSEFAHFFWTVYKKLYETKEHDLDMPMYFRFLTILMFRVFLEADVDVAVIEVGIGGELDSTNIIRKPVCVGITSLGLDHTRLLGDTIEEIAYQKSGIFKANAFAFTVPQSCAAMTVLERRAREKGCTLNVVPPFEYYQWISSALPVLPAGSSIQRYNASLAIQLAARWMAVRQRGDESLSGTTMYHGKDGSSMKRIAAALSSSEWPGRTQTLSSSVADFYLDGAHTIDSMEHCILWFTQTTLGKSGERLLIFNVSGDRQSYQLLSLLKPLKFTRAYFVPNIAGISSADDSMNSLGYTNTELDKCERNRLIWGKDSIVADNVLRVLHHVKTTSTLRDEHKAQILVTGSLHLVGAVLAILDPDLTMKTDF